MKKLIVAALAVLASCARQDANNDGVEDGIRVPDSVSVVTATNAVGSVSGQTVDSKLKPFAGVNVTLILGKPTDGTAYKTTSDADGNFFFKNVPAPSSGQLIFSITDYGTVRTTVNIGASAGQFPVNDANANVGQVGLFKLDSTIKLSVFTALGRPATGAKGYLEVTPVGFTTTSGTYGNATGVVAIEAAVDSDGVLTFNGVPNLIDLARISTISFTPTIQVTIAGLDENSDGRMEFNGTSVGLAASSLLQQNQPPIVLADARSTQTFTVVASNIATLTGGTAQPLRNFLRANDTINVIFNHPVLANSLLVRVTDENCATVVNTTAALKAGNATVLSITAGSGWNPGREYNIAIRATSIDSGVTISRTGYFFAGDPNMPEALSTSASFQVKKATGNMLTNVFQPGDELYAVFNQALRNTAGPNARIFVNFDLNANGGINFMNMNDNGEFGSTVSTITITPAEPVADATTGTFACTASNYTTRFLVTGMPVPAMGIPMSTQVKVVLPRDSSATGGYQTIWGLGAVGDFNGAISMLP